VPLVRAHYDALQRAFRNLIRNAVEALVPERPPLIDVAVLHGDAGIRIIIGDNGCGIPAERVERIFEPDFTLKAGGTGLGLAVVRQAVAAHGGTVYARARMDGGAEFIIDLPVRGPDGMDPSHTGTATPSANEWKDGS
jgi:signal transduction histidine kinase